MSKQVQITLRIPKEIHEQAKTKCNEKFGIGVSHLLKIFLRSFIAQKGIGFYVGDDDLCLLISKWLLKRSYEKPYSSRQRNGKYRSPGPNLKDIYDL